MVDWSARTKEVGAKFGLGDWFWRQIRTESKFDPNAYNSKSGATGIAQIIQRYHPTVNPRDPEASLNYAANWMRQLIAQYTSAGKSNPTAYALAAYNWGPGNVQTWNGKRETLPAETRLYLDEALGKDWNGGGGGGITLPGLPTIPTIPGLPTLPSVDAAGQWVWEFVDGLRERVRTALVTKAKEMAAFWGGPVAFWLVGLAFLFFGLLGLALSGLRASERVQQTARKTLAVVVPQGRAGRAATAGAAAAGAIL